MRTIAPARRPRRSPQCDRFIRTYPNHPNVDYAYYLKGLVYFREDQGLLGYVYELDLSERDPKAMRESFAAFKELVTKFPDSRYSPDAIDRMRYLTNALALYEVKVARYYYNRGAYIAAVNRAQGALTTYPQTPANEEALEVLVQSYDKLGLPQLRDDAQRVLEQTFPRQQVPHGRIRPPVVEVLVGGSTSLDSVEAAPRQSSQRPLLAREKRLHVRELPRASHRRQAPPDAPAVRLVGEPRVADHQHAAIGLGADQPPGALLQAIAACGS